MSPARARSPAYCPFPGLAEHGIGFKTIGEAIYLRNHVLSRLDLAASVTDPERQRCALSFVFVGGGVRAWRRSPNCRTWRVTRCAMSTASTNPTCGGMLVEAATRIMPEVSVALGAYTADRLAERNIDVRLSTRLESVVDGHVVLSDGDEFDTETVVWTAGVKANPMLAATDCRGTIRADCRVTLISRCAMSTTCSRPVTARRYRTCRSLTSRRCALRVRNTRCANPRPWRTTSSRPCGAARGTDYVHAYAGSVASLGLYRGVAEIYGIRLRGIVAWFMHRTYHVMRMPTFNRKVRVLADWTEALFFQREVVALGQLQQPHSEFKQAAGLQPLPPASSADAEAST